MNLQRLLWFVLVGTVSWALIMFWEFSEYRKPQIVPEPQRSLCKDGAVSVSIASLELARTPQCFTALIDQGNSDANEVWNAVIVRVNTCMDFLFIALYGSVFSLLALHLGKWPGVFVIPLISLAAIFDVSENVHLLQAVHGVIARQQQFPAPGSVSEIKWYFFAASLLALGISLALTKRLWPIVISLLMFGAGVLTALGVSHLQLLVWALLLLGAALFVALFYYFPFHPFGWSKLFTWIEFAYLIRFPLIAALLLAVLLPAGYFLAPSLFVGLFDALGFWSFVFVSAASVHLAWTVMVTVRLVYRYGPSRFPGIAGIPPAVDLSWGTALPFALLAAPCIVIASCGTPQLVWYEKLTGIAIGAAVATGFLWIAAQIQFQIEPPAGSSTRAIFPFQAMRARADSGRSYLGALIDNTAQRLLPGDTHPGLVTPEGRLHSGHQLAATTLGVSLFLYASIGFFYSPKIPVHREATELAFRAGEGAQLASLAASPLIPTLSTTHPPAALFYLLYLLTILTLLFSGIAFALDKIRLPVLTTALAFSLLVGIVFDTDHYFRVTPAPDRAPLNPAEVVQVWESKRAQGDPNKPMIVVATAGGGIRAAAWTAQVLTGLAETNHAPGHDFSSSLLLVSSVSGGSVGNMFVVGSYDAQGQLRPAILHKIRKSSESSSLSAVGWGLLFPDLMRTLPAGSLFSDRLFGPEVDRGWALETQWLANWQGALWPTPPTIRQWTHDVSEGTRPAAIFNATAVESGQRYLVASTVMSLDEKSAIQFARKYSQYDVGVSTAARVSATFPWVSPNPRLSDGRGRMGVHLADGGYYDNSGTLSAIQWLQEAAVAIKNHPVLFVVIDSTAGSPAEGKAWSWQRQAVGPVETLLSVRDSSQVSRARVELDLALSQLRNQSRIDITEYDLCYPPDPLTPLSWHLTKEQIDRMHDAWLCPTDQLKEETKAFAEKMNDPARKGRQLDTCRR